MADNEIIKDLERISLYSGFSDNVINTLLDALDLIKQQRENIERLQSMNRAKLDTIHDLQADTNKLKEQLQAEIEQWKEEANKYQKLWCIAVDDIETAKSEAYKEFAEKLNEKLCDCHIVSDGEYCGFDCSDVHECVDNLVKEVVGDIE